MKRWCAPRFYQRRGSVTKSLGIEGNGEMARATFLPTSGLFFFFAKKYSILGEKGGGAHPRTAILRNEDKMKGKTNPVSCCL